jgi:hypothetical protein
MWEVPHWTSIEHEDNSNPPGCASVLDMDDTSSCAEIELDPPSHHQLRVDKTQSEPTPLLSPLVEISSSKSLPSTLDRNLSASNDPGPNDQIPR